MQTQNESNYFISVQTIDNKNISSSLNNLNSTNSININDNSKNNLVILPKDNNYIFSSFIKKEFKKKKQRLKSHSYILLPSIKKSLNKELNRELNKYGKKNTFSKFKPKNFQVSIEKKPKIYNHHYLTSLIENVEYKSKNGKILMKIKRIHLIISILLFLNIIFSPIDNLINKNESYQIIKNGYINNNEYEKLLNNLKKRKLTKKENFFRIISFLTTIAIIIFLTIKEVLIYKNNLIYQTLQKRVLIFIFSSIFFIPILNPIYIIKQNDCIYPIFIVDIFFFLNISKIFVISYILLNFSSWGNAFSQLICYNYSVMHGYLFSIKAKLKNNPFLYLLFVFFIFCIIGVYLLRTFEFASFLINKTPIENYETNLNSIINVIWLLLLSFFNVGFGDYYPKTIFSRFLFFTIAIFGIICIYYLLRNIMNFTIMTQSEKKVFLKMLKLYSNENLEYKSVKVIFYLLKLRKNITLYNKEENEYLKKLYLKKIICFFIILNRYLKNFTNNDKIDDIYSIPVDDLINNVENKIKENLTNFETSFAKLDTLGNELKQLSNIQKHINKNMKIISNKQDYLSKFFTEINNLHVIERIKNTIKQKKSHQFNTLENLNGVINLSKKGKTLKFSNITKQIKGLNQRVNSVNSLSTIKESENSQILSRNGSITENTFLNLSNPFLSLNKGVNNSQIKYSSSKFKNKK